MLAPCQKFTVQHFVNLTHSKCLNLCLCCKKQLATYVHVFHQYSGRELQILNLYMQLVSGLLKLKLTIAKLTYVQLIIVRSAYTLIVYAGKNLPQVHITERGTLRRSLVRSWHGLSMVSGQVPHKIILRVHRRPETPILYSYVDLQICSSCMYAHIHLIYTFHYCPNCNGREYISSKFQ